MATTRSGSAPTSVSKHLKGIHFPANKNDLVDRARKNGASDDVIRAIQSMPQREYGSMADVMKGYSQKG